MLALAGATLLAGCAGDLSSVDARTDRVLREKALSVGGGMKVPTRQWPSRVETPKGSSLTDYNPESNNPAAAQLGYVPAKETRDVAARLAAYQALEDDPNARELTLEGAFKQAQLTGREYLSAEEEYILSAVRLLIERHRFSPRLFADSTVTYNQFQADGKRDLTMRVLNQAGVRQQLPVGGEVAARWVWDATDNLRAAASGGYVQSSRLVLDGNIPLLRGFGDVACEDLIQSERNTIYAARDFERFRREYLVSLARDYFELLNAQYAIASQRRQLESLIELEARQRAWYDAGQLAEFEVNLATNNVLQARATLANLTETYILLVDRFKVRVGIPVRELVRITGGEIVAPEPEITLEKATELALALRLDLQNRRDQLEDSKRSVKIAKNQLLPDLNAFGTVTLPTKGTAREGGSVYEFDDSDYTVGATLSLPLDRETERLQLRQTTIQLAQAQRAFDRFRDELILDVRARVREVERATLNLQLAEERVKINLRRKEEQSLKPDEVTTREQVDTANDLRDAERARDQAKTDLRNSVLDFLVVTGQLRVKHDGTFEQLPGMSGQVNQAEKADAVDGAAPVPPELPPKEPAVNPGP
jgi:outer membrane protein TolC